MLSPVDLVLQRTRELRMLQAYNRLLRYSSQLANYDLRPAVLHVGYIVNDGTVLPRNRRLNPSMVALLRNRLQGRRYSFTSISTPYNDLQVVLLGLHPTQRFATIPNPYDRRTRRTGTGPR